MSEEIISPNPDEQQKPSEQKPTVKSAEELLDEQCAAERKKQQEAEELKERERKAHEETERLSLERAVRAAANEAGILFHGPVEELIKMLQFEPGLRISSTSCHLNGQRITLKEALEVFATHNQHMVNYWHQQVVAEQQKEQDAQVKNIADLRTPADKIRWIQDHGLESFEDLLVNGEPLKPWDAMTSEEWHKAPRKWKIEVLGRYGEARVTQAHARNDREAHERERQAKMKAARDKASGRG